VTTLVTGTRFQLRSRKARTPQAARWASGILILMAVLAIFGPVLAPHPPDATDLMAINAGPSAAHLFGTDEIGRDILSRILTAARISLLGPLIVMVVSTALGTVIAVTAAWIGGRVDACVGVVTDITLAFPSTLLAILVAAFVGPGVWAPIIAITIAYVPYSTRIIRGTALAERSLPYIEALHLQGFRGITVCARHLVPNISGILAALGTLTYGYAMVDLAAVSFLGLGVQPPNADWGTMVSQGKVGLLAGAPQEAIAAGGFIVATVIAINILGEALADRANGRTS
jgi:peptide/nickel transport system permease protein